MALPEDMEAELAAAALPDEGQEEADGGSSCSPELLDESEGGGPDVGGWGDRRPVSAARFDLLMKERDYRGHEIQRLQATATENAATQASITELRELVQSTIPRPEATPEQELAQTMATHVGAQVGAPLQKELGEIRTRLDQEQATRQQADWQNKVRAYIETDRGQMLQAHPDFDDAMGHLVAARQKEYAAGGYGPEEATQHIRQELDNMTMQALQAKTSPGTYLYGIAQKYGWEAPAAENGNGNRNPMTGSPSPGSSAAADSRRQRLQRNTRTLSSVPGKAGAAATSDDDLRSRVLAANDKQFGALVKEFGLSRITGLGAVDAPG